MDKQQVAAWIAGIAARGIAWILAAKLGMNAAESDSAGLAIAQAVAALVLTGISIYSSVKGRKTLAAADPPEKK